MPPNPTATQRRSAALTICKTLGDELSVVAKPLAKVNIRNIPDSVEPAIRNWIRTHAGKHEVYGSAAAATHRVGGRRPADLDIIVTNPRVAATALAGIMQRKSVRCKVVASKSPGAFVVQVLKKYDFHGESKPPMAKKGINIQRAADQLLRKANAVTAKQPDGRMGAAEHRNLKDTQDFIATAKTLLASMQLKSKAEQARAKKVKEAIRVWERHLKTIKGAPKPPKRKPISNTRQKRFKAKARAKPDQHTDNLIFAGSGTKVTERETPRGGILGLTGSPYAGDPYAGKAHDPYGKGAARDPYAGVPTLGEAVSTKKTRRRNPSKKKNKR
jgi:hypothetical protein